MIVIRFALTCGATRFVEVKENRRGLKEPRRWVRKCRRTGYLERFPCCWVYTCSGVFITENAHKCGSPTPHLQRKNALAGFFQRERGGQIAVFHHLRRNLQLLD